MQCGCAKPSFPSDTCSWGWGLGFPMGCNIEGFFFLAFISLQQEEMKLQHCNWDVVWSWVQTAVYIVSFVFQGPLKKDRTAKEETA